MYVQDAIQQGQKFLLQLKEQAGLIVTMFGPVPYLSSEGYDFEEVDAVDFLFPTGEYDASFYTERLENAFPDVIWFPETKYIVGTTIVGDETLLIRLHLRDVCGPVKYAHPVEGVRIYGFTELDGNYAWSISGELLASVANEAAVSKYNHEHYYRTGYITNCNAVVANVENGFYELSDSDRDLVDSLMTEISDDERGKLIKLVKNGEIITYTDWEEAINRQIEEYLQVPEHIVRFIDADQLKETMKEEWGYVELGDGRVVEAIDHLF